jgi:hypothetical protein
MQHVVWCLPPNNELVFVSNTQGQCLYANQHRVPSAAKCGNMLWSWNNLQQLLAASPAQLDHHTCAVLLNNQPPSKPQVR